MQISKVSARNTGCRSNLSILKAHMRSEYCKSLGVSDPKSDNDQFIWYGQWNPIILKDAKNMLKELAGNNQDTNSDIVHRYMKQSVTVSLSVVSIL